MVATWKIPMRWISGVSSNSASKHVQFMNSQFGAMRTTGEVTSFTNVMEMIFLKVWREKFPSVLEKMCRCVQLGTVRGTAGIRL
jgi:hypothetical protein